MSRLSDLLETALPRSTSSPIGNRPAAHTQHFTPPVPQGLHFSRMANMDDFEDDPYADLAKEFGVEAHLVEALAQRLSRIS